MAGGCGRIGCTKPYTVGEAVVSTENMIRVFKNSEVVDKKLVAEGHQPAVSRLVKKELWPIQCNRELNRRALELNEGCKILLRPGVVESAAPDSASRKKYKKLGGG